MVGKLFKHEIAGLGKLMFPVLCAVLGIGVFTRILQFFAADSITYGIVETSSYVVLFIAMFVSIILALIFGVVRYYKNLFTGEGYLTFTLPVTAAQHIWVKATVAVLFMAIAVVVSLVSLTISFLGRDLIDIWDAAVYILDFVFSKYADWHLVFYIIEGVLLVIASVFMMFFLYYSCITIGQMAKKNRVMAAVGVYFIYYIITQVLGTIFIILVSVYEYLIPFDKIAEFVDKHTYLCGHLGLIGLTLFCAIMTLIYYFICHTIVRKKLNLE